LRQNPRVLHADSAHRIAALLLAEEFDDLSAPPADAPRLRALAFLALFLAVALNAARDTGSLATSAPVPPRWTTSAQQDPTKRVHGMAHKNTLTKAAAAAALSVGSLATAQDAVQWRVEDGGNGHWYQCLSTTQPMTHLDAKNLAAGRSADLASLCGAEFDFVVLATGALETSVWTESDSSQWIGPWIGLELSPSGWIWSDGTACIFDRWDGSLAQPDSPSQPGEVFACFYTVGTAPAPIVHDVPSHFSTRAAIIEWSADCNNDGIVDFGQIRAGLLADIDGNGVPDCCTSGSCTLAPVQWSNSAGGNGHWYAGVAASEPISWSNARAAADALGGHLATISSAAEDDLVAALALLNTSVWPIADRYGPWLGGYQPSPSGDPFGNWAWVTGEPWSYVPTTAQFDNSSRPDGQHDDYLHYIDHLQIWNDVRNDGDTYYGIGVRGYMIEWSADCNNDGIVDFGQIRAGELEDANGNNIPDCCEGGASCNCPGDVIPDGVVDGVDLAAVLGQWGSAGDKSFSADANGDGTVDAGDLSIVLNGWGACP
jgi:hypothetical protein